MRQKVICLTFTLHNYLKIIRVYEFSDKLIYFIAKI